MRLAALVENDRSWQENIRDLGFTPQIYSCDYPLLSQEIIREIQAEGMRVIPWTVNDTTTMRTLVEWGVDGIITDYPNRAIELLK